MGDGLAESSKVLRESLADLPEIKHKMFGTQVHGPGATSDGDTWRRMLTAEMLYAFAVENWLKGILICTFIRSSGTFQRKAQETLGQELGIPDKVEPWQFFLLLIIAITGTLPETSAQAHESFLTQIALEDSLRLDAIRRHREHDLVQLADDAGLKLSKSLRSYLARLSDIVQLGRYPAHIRKDVGDLAGFVGNEKLRINLELSISNRVDEVLASMPSEELEALLERFKASE